MKNDIVGYWQMVSFEAFTSIISSPRHYEASEEERYKIEETFQFVLDNTYYNFQNDTVYFADYKEHKMFDKVGRWHIKSDTLYINDLSKIQTYKFFLKKVDADSLVMNLIHKNGDISRNDMVFIRR
ncbi:lipocalin family protein [Litoribacter alkaliphilus]|uniref:Lipocalin family protein n=1 Tax=Litoribacter ruber TaxID=702568 RepID=A0AAP2CKQ7_9BACT|nr:lipocalin family protein [Litoribacter alkaliphilus]MBS9523602.1 lipocalin family protein [Litoribacter alkaliphilus]